MRRNLFSGKEYRDKTADWIPILVITAVIALILTLLPSGVPPARAAENSTVATAGAGERDSEVGEEKEASGEAGGGEAAGENTGDRGRDGESGNVFARFLNVLLAPFQADSGRDINANVRVSNLSVVNTKNPNDEIHVGGSVLVRGEFVFEDLGREGALSGDYFDLPVPGLLRWDEIPFDRLGPNEMSWGECSRKAGTEDFRCVLNEEIEYLMDISGGWEGHATALQEGKLFDGSVVLPPREVSLAVFKTGEIGVEPVIFAEGSTRETEFDSYSTINWRIVVHDEDLKDLSGDLVLFDEFDRGDIHRDQKICELPAGASLEERLNLDLLYPVQPVITERDGGIEFRFPRPDTVTGFGDRELDLRFTLCTSSDVMDPMGTTYDNHVLATSFMGNEVVRAESAFSFTQNQHSSGYIDGDFPGTFSVQKQLAADSVPLPAGTAFTVLYEEFAPGVDPTTGEAAFTDILSILADGIPVSGENAREEGWTIRLTEPTFSEIPGIEFGEPLFAAALSTASPSAADPKTTKSNVEILDGGKTALVSILPRANVAVTLTNTARHTTEPSIGTTANVVGATMLRLTGGEVVDTVVYRDLQPTTGYQLHGELIHVDHTGRPTPTGIEAASRFTTGAAPEGTHVVSGSTTVTFEISEAAANKYAGEKLVVFETLLDTEDKVLAQHHDPTDVAQTFEVANFHPEISTTAAVTGSETKTVLVTGGEVIDTITYRDLQPTTEYQLTGELMQVDAAGKPTPTGMESTGRFTTGEASEGRLTVAGSTTLVLSPQIRRTATPAKSW